MRVTALAVLVLSFVYGQQARAQMLEVSPVSIIFTPEQRTSSLTITNRSAAAIVIQVRPFMWRETDDVATLTETSALAASPPFATIAPGQAQAIRLLLREPPGATEATYRLLIDQIPPPATAGVRVALRLSLPVFAQPGGHADAALDWQVVQGRSGAELDVHNHGNRHATIISAQVSAPNGATVPIRTATHPYVLAGASAHWPIGGARWQNGGAVRLTITSDTGVREATASIVSDPP